MLARRGSSGGEAILPLEDLGIAPEVFESVVFARGIIEEMYDDVAVIDDGPIRAFGLGRHEGRQTELLEPYLKLLRGAARYAAS